MFQTTGDSLQVEDTDSVDIRRSFAAAVLTSLVVLSQVWRSVVFHKQHTSTYDNNTSHLEDRDGNVGTNREKHLQKIKKIPRNFVITIPVIHETSDLDFDNNFYTYFYIVELHQVLHEYLKFSH